MENNEPMNEKQTDEREFTHSDQIDKAFAYHKPTDDGLRDITTLRREFSNLKRVLQVICLNSRERSEAFTHLESACMWAVKARVANDSQSEIVTN